MNDKTKVPEECTMHSFAAKDFTNITKMHKWYVDKYIDEILCLMRGRQLAYSDSYDAADRLIDLNFYNNFKDRYYDIHRRSGPGGHIFDKLVSTFEWDEDMIKYVRVKRPYPHGKSWTKAKRIFVVMNVEVKYFLAIEILLDEEKIKVYGYNLPVFNEDTFLTYVQPLLKLFPKLLTQSKLIDHLSAKVLMKELWGFEGRNKNIRLPKNKIGAAYGSYSLAYIECLLPTQK
ncbi:hypothetical protein P3S67_010220 [Capsicum chacoense]